ncbi:MAG: hypothetical protein ACRD7E_25545 [Bryobacteraceae bacterium]
MSDDSAAWNYFNYFTEIEEHFQRARGTGLFLLSPLDWALIESWKNAGIPLEAVLRGIDVAFEKWRGRKRRIQQINSIAYCAQAVHSEAQLMAAAAPARRQPTAAAPFTLEELTSFLSGNAAKLSGQEPYKEIGAALEALAAEVEVHYTNLEQLEQRLTALEEKMSALAKLRQTDEDLFEIRRELDTTLRPYRGKMTAEQLSMLERQYMERQVLERARLPRLSLFYLIE